MKKFLLALFLISLPLNAQYIEEFRAVKLTDIDSPVLYSDKNIAEAMDYLASINVNVVLPVVWNGGYTQYPSQVMDSLFGKPQDPAFAGRDPLERLVIEARRVGIEVLPWFEYGFAAWYSGGSPPFGGHILQKYPEWALRTADGKVCVKNGFDWMSAVNPDVQDLIKKLTMEVVEKYDIDGIEYSDRIPALPVEGGYDSVTVSIYKAEHDGAEPPSNYNDPDWMRWRADKLNQWYDEMRRVIKEADKNLFVSSSPSLYPWSYQEYLQDGKSWLEEGIIDHFIPQLYRYNFSDYEYELDKAVDLAEGAGGAEVFAGILMNIGMGNNAYVITPEFLLQSIEANRERDVRGEAYFYYEGLKKNNYLLGDTLKATWYKEYAYVPGRNLSARRPPSIIINEQEALLTGEWTEYSMQGYEGLISRTNFAGYSSAEYRADIPASAYYDIYFYSVPNTPWADSAAYMLYSEGDSLEVIFNQGNLARKGWQKLSTLFLQEGNNKILKLDNRYLKENEYLVTDAVMLTVNRKLSPDAEIPVTSIKTEFAGTQEIPSGFSLNQNYPNPFNPTTRIEYNLPEDSKVTLKVYDIIGREIGVLADEFKQAGKYSVRFDASGLPSGVYIYRLQAGTFSESRKMILLK